MSDKPTSTSPIAWFEIQVPELEQAKSFYGAVFGWTFQPYGEGFEMATSPDGQPVCGLDQSAGDVSPAGRHVRIYLATDELEGLLSRVTKAGGTVVAPRTLIDEENGWFATIADPSGMHLSLMTFKPA